MLFRKQNTGMISIRKLNPVGSINWRAVVV